MGVEKKGVYHNLKIALSEIETARSQASRDKKELEKLTAMLKEAKKVLDAHRLQLNTNTEDKVTEVIGKIEEYLEAAHKGDIALYNMINKLMSDFREELRKK